MPSASSLTSSAAALTNLPKRLIKAGQVVRPAPVQEVPNHLRAGVSGGAQHGKKARPVVMARRAFDQMPTQPIPHCAYPVSRQRAVVCRRVKVVTSCRKKIETAPIAAAVGRAFKASKKEALEELAFWKHRRAQAKGSPLQRRMEPLLVQLSPVTADDSTDLDGSCLIHDSTFDQRTTAARLSGG